MAIDLVEVTAERRPLFEALLGYYQYDFTEYTGEDVDDSGRFETDFIDRYFRGDPDRCAFLLRVDGRWAGVILLKRGALMVDEPATMVVVEFFVMRKFRRTGAGEAMARAIWDRFPARWEVRQLASNTPAQAFWREIIGRYTGGRFEERAWTDEQRGVGGTVQYFDSRDRAGEAD